MSYAEMIEQLESAKEPSPWIDARLDAMFRVGAARMREQKGFEWAWKNFPIWAAHKQAQGMCGVQHENGDLGLIWDSPNFTASVDSAILLCKLALPGWAWRVATCSVSDDAWVFPDFNCPVHGDRLKREFRQDIDWTDITDVDLRPAGRQAIALCISILQAKQAIEAAA